MLNSRRGFLGTAANALLASAWRGRVSAQTKDRKWNILYLHSHDSGRYLRPYGHAVPTPNLARLARQGVIFRQMHAAAPVCSASRAALLTGQCPHQNGMLGLAHLGWSLHDYNQVFIHTATRYGYQSILAGLQHIAADPEKIGYDQILPHASNRAQDVAPAAARFLRSKPKQPFFLDVGFFETHREYPQATDNPEYVQPPWPIPDTPETRLDMARFHASARLMDGGVGEVLAALDDARLTQNTLVISTTDHGIAFPDMKCSLRDTGLAVSMIMRGPEPFTAGKVCDALLSQIDVFPTLCDLLGFERPAWLEGKSVLPILQGKQQEINEAIFGEVTYHAAYEPKRCVRTKRWKYIRHFDGRHQPNLPNCDDGLSKDYWLKLDWKDNVTVPGEQLFDLVFDPAERNNLAGEASHQAVLHEMKGRLQSWMESTHDPLLKGPVPLVPGGHTVSPDEISPAALGKYAPTKLT
jgi:N-sulfoglucosamine sulfohydrolase